MEEKKTPKPAAAQPLPLIEGQTVVTEEVSWLWYPYIPLGKLTIIEGDPGLGKSWVSCDLVAAITTGRLLPCQEMPFPASKVLMLSGEDGLEDTVVPRLKTLGADLSKVYFPRGVFTLNEGNIKRLEATMRQVAATVVTIDPVQLFFGSEKDMNKANDVRAFMGMLHEAAHRCGCAVVLIRHLRKQGKKDEGGNALYRGLGSIDFVGAARSVIQVTQLRGGDKVFQHVKHNLSPQGAALGFDIQDGRFLWTGQKTVVELEDPGPATKAPKHKEVAVWLGDYLDGRSVPAKQCIADGIRAGHTQGTLVSVKAQIAKSVKVGEAWQWKLKDAVQEAMDAKKPGAAARRQPVPVSTACPECWGSGIAPNGAACSRGCT